MLAGFIFIFIYIYSSCRSKSTAAAEPSIQSPLAGNTLHLPDAASAWRWQSSSKDSQLHPRHTHTLCHTLLHRLVSIINRLARQEACAAASHREASRGVAGRICCCLLGVRDLAYLIIMSRAFSCSDDADADDDYSNTNTPDGSTHPFFPSACPRRWLRDDGSMLGLRLPLSLRMIDGFCGTQLL